MLGWLLVLPLAVNIGYGLYIGALSLFTDYNKDQMGSIELTGLAMLLIVTVPLALGGRALIRSGRRASGD